MRTQIWEDKWIPVPTTFRVISSRRALHRANGQLVSCLIDHDMHVWKTELVCNTFLPHKAKTILNIPLSALPMEDHQIWSATANGKFSV